MNRLVVASAGWFTWIDPLRPFPHGVASTTPGAAEADVRAFLALPVLVLAGERDVHRDAKLRTSARVDRIQGLNRLARALAWTDHLEECARDYGLPSSVVFDVLEGCRHSFRESVASAGLVERVVDFLRPAPSPESMKAET